ncbi:MAG TPA: fumarylacetoacetase [Bacteroidia bacterium]|nr:fumarylacetoacetase [Bacteroidia bacterium]HRS57873.1 fumarylacetoacetase [Bacteroidia bacterium]HRU69272.1 fumarylacetoacetase [Bacteroidia bacterium]
MEKKIKSWLDYSPDSDFSIYNIPFGIIENKSISPRVASRIGDVAIDLKTLAELGYLEGIGLRKTDSECFDRNTLNDFIGLGKTKTNAVRNRIISLFSEDNDLKVNQNHLQRMLIPVSEVNVLCPVRPTDYTDFYSSIEHATNVGKMFRDKDNPLLPNWRHLPVGYHGRSSSIVGSGAEIYRPKGQIFDNTINSPVFSPSKKLDFELEMAFITTGTTCLGDSVPVDKAEDYIFGFVIFNDLSARDIQQWEYVPLGPFLGKNFGSVISNWVVTLEALEPFRTSGPEQNPKVLPYLQTDGKKNFDVHLEVCLQAEQTQAHLICRSNMKYLYWNVCQQLAHQTVNGCNLNNAGIYASGTISGPDEHSFGSMLELSWNGTKAVKTPEFERFFIEDNDTIIMKAYAIQDEIRVGFGECVVKILPAKS